MHEDDYHWNKNAEAARQKVVLLKRSFHIGEFQLVMDVMHAVQYADGDYRILDATGRKTASEAQKEFADVVSAAALRWAQTSYKNLQKEETAIDGHAMSVIEALRIAQAYARPMSDLPESPDYALLDPSGKRSARDMEVEFKEAVSAGYVREGRYFLRGMQHGADYSKELGKLIAEQKIFPSDLDPKGEKTDEQMMVAIRLARQGVERNSGWKRG